MDSDNDEVDDTFCSQPWGRPFPSVLLTSTSSDLTDVLHHLSQALSRAVDFEVALTSKRIQGVVYDKSDRCQFSLQLVPQRNDSTQFVVEFQRRSGPCKIFASFLARTTANLESVDLFTHVERVLLRQSSELSAGDAASPSGVAPGLDKDSCVQLVDMCASDFEDVRLEAFKTLLPLMSASADIHKHTEGRLVPIMVRAGGTTDNMEDLAWCLAYLAHHMCALPEFAQCAQPLVPLLFSMLAARPTLAGRGTQRQAARALLLIARADVSALLNHKDLGSYLDSLDRLSFSADPALQASVKGVQDILAASC
jgi:hypothetical protein